MRSRYTWDFDDVDGFYYVEDETGRRVRTNIPTKGEARWAVGHLTKRDLKQARRAMRRHEREVPDLVEMFA